ncbi:hypothetical protein [Natrialba sp. SSL1]|uniref:hypothetical protein n=1 Tax=Natrialba sp. SSL1 TaxID=1869245 RepID=UPI0008F83F80|nr:hypothetical protein [Natrialba sp. SSL1]OIB58318.1 hypothetical protein BBD46_08305 [Natrialba sp. SSL1]
MSLRNNDGAAKRRTILKSIGAATGFSVVGSPAAAYGTDSPVEFEGISYDSKTDVEQGLTRAELEFDDEGVSGELQISGFQVPVDGRTELSSESESDQSYRFELEEQQFEVDGLSLKGGFKTDGERLGGYLTRPGPLYHPLGFSMHNIEKDVGVEAIRGILSDDQEVPSEIVLPDTGVPKLEDKKNTPNKPPSDDKDSFGEDLTASSDDHRIIPTGNELKADSESYYPDDNCAFSDTVTDWRHYDLTYSLFESDDLAPYPEEDDDSVEIQQGGNRVMYLHGVWHNGNRPENVVHEDCTGGEYPADALSVEYTVTTIEDNLEPNNMLPEEDDGDSGISEWVDTGLDVVGAIPNAWTTVGSSVVRLFLPDEDTSYITTNLSEPVAGGTQCYWEFDLDYGTDEFPTDREEAQTVRVTLGEGGNSTGSTHEVDVGSEYTYMYAKHNDDCPCTWSWKTSTTKVSTSFEMDVVDLG